MNGSGNKEVTNQTRVAAACEANTDVGDDGFHRTVLFGFIDELCEQIVVFFVFRESTARFL